MTRFAVFFLLSCVSIARENLPANEALLSLLAREWQYELRHDPELATIVGDSHHNDRWKDYSISAELRRPSDIKHWLSTFRNIDPTTLSEEGRLNRTLIIGNLEERVEAIRLKNYESPINPHSGVHLAWTELAGVTPFRDVKDCDDYGTRLQRLPRAVDQILEVLRQGIRDKLVPPKDLLLKTVPQCRAIAMATGTANPFAAPLSHMSAAVCQGEAAHIRREIFNAINNDVRPSYARLADFIANSYAPQGRKEPGIWALPNGDARYRFAVRQITTLAMSPEEIFQLGVKEVARIEAAELILAKQLGFENVEETSAAR